MPETSAKKVVRSEDETIEKPYLDEVKEYSEPLILYLQKVMKDVVKRRANSPSADPNVQIEATIYAPDILTCVRVCRRPDGTYYCC